MSLKQALMLKNKKGNLGNVMGGKVNLLVGVLIGIVVVAILLGALTPIIFTSVENFTDSLVAFDTTGLASAFVVIIGIVLVLFLIGLLFAAMRGGSRK